jgi:hypothetical protein
VNSTHPDYDASAFDWSRARDVLAGEDAVKSAGEKYLRRLDSQTRIFSTEGKGENSKCQHPTSRKTPSFKLQISGKALAGGHQASNANQ